MSVTNHTGCSGREMKAEISLFRFQFVRGIDSLAVNLLLHSPFPKVESGWITLLPAFLGPDQHFFLRHKRKRRLLRSLFFPYIFSKLSLRSKRINGSRVGQIGPVDSCGQVKDLDLTLVKSRNLSRVGQVRQVRPADSCGQVRNIDPSGSKWQA